MPARDRYHDQVKNALIKDGWTITDDPLHVKWGKKDLYVDLGAEQLLAAEKGERKIAVEVKSFLGHSEMADLEQAVGQYTIYHDVLSRAEPERALFLAIDEETYDGSWAEIGDPRWVACPRPRGHGPAARALHAHEDVGMPPGDPNTSHQFRPMSHVR